MTSLALCLALCAAAPVQTETSDDGWVSMFDGKSLDGWKINEDGAWAVEDGAIKVSGNRSHLFHNKELRNFVFETEVKTTPGSNSGIFICTKYQDEGWPEQGYEVQVNVSHGDPVKSGSLYNTVKRFDAGVKDGEWYTQRIEVRGDKVRVSINDELLYEFVEPPGVSISRKLGKGVIALQAHDPNSVVYFRNLKYKDLSGE
ncbi:3-keto-disaccharide hydrolase [Alienimonas californiensis]|uniref:3-keto-alpha-glucoside-1,2-lyase/3-keto-2-hydroxy-glucal hydratase domain-containing protein n=1 Tax=Alienimonas californiensis TaxID=2527989 RepID=A0A517P9V4_9PLAN|nr:DUF1080 domain-containing protein [Alienimonas californiensis]QDT16157.1 hypothetical protein CA12_22550 [Alienimonas californiensis]